MKFRTDAELEQLIEAYRIVMTLKPNRVWQQEAQARMVELIGCRSQERVREMEIERGLLKD